MRRALVDWYTANILLVIRGPEAAAPSDSNLFNKWTKVQVRSVCVLVFGRTLTGVQVMLTR
jgi:hypothetical protein